MKNKVVFAELAFIEGKITYKVNGSTYEVKENLKKIGFEWVPWHSQWEMVLTGTRKEIVAKAKELTRQIEAFVVVDFSARASNISLDKAFAEKE